jgi:hypothetical protein
MTTNFTPEDRARLVRLETKLTAFLSAQPPVSIRERINEEYRSGLDAPPPSVQDARYRAEHREGSGA